MPFSAINKQSDFLDYVSDNFEAVYWLPGNHEYYHGDIIKRSGSFKESVRSNVFLINNETIVIAEITFIFSTLWSSISPAAEWDIASGMNDYKVISRGKQRFRPLHSNRLHRESRQFIENVVKGAIEKIIVTTHHAPTFMNYPEQYRGSAISEAFATELFQMIEASPIDYWIYGHHYSNVEAFEIGGTKLLTNQLGYVEYGEQLGYKSDAVIDIQ